MLKNEYLKRVYDEVQRRDAHEPEFLQAVQEGDTVTVSEDGTVTIE